MKYAHIVTDIGFGDSGKGAMTDRILAQASGSKVAVRYTGGSQAGHTVDHNSNGCYYPNKRHIHASFASGTMAGFDSHMSHYCPIYPQKLAREAVHLMDKIPGGLILSEFCSVDPLAPMITIFDVAWNRAVKSAYNTVGIGIGATMERQLLSEFKTFMADLNHPEVLRVKLRNVRRYYEDKMVGLPGSVVKKFDEVVGQEKLDPRDALQYVTLRDTQTVLATHESVVFEGAQGIMLDQDHGFIPDVTWGYTTSRNAVEMIQDYGFEVFVQANYVTRAYQTRHGDGPMTSDKMVDVPKDRTNVWNAFQGSIRSGTLDLQLLKYAIDVDLSYLNRLKPCHGGLRPKLHITCCDHVQKHELAGPLMFLMEHDGIGEICCWRGASRYAAMEKPQIPQS